MKRGFRALHPTFRQPAHRRSQPAISQAKFGDYKHRQAYLDRYCPGPVPACRTSAKPSGTLRLAQQTSATSRPYQPSKMSDDEADPELLELLRQHLNGKLNIENQDPETGVLEDVEFLYDNSIDVSMNMRATKNAAATIWNQMQSKGYSTSNWVDHPFHPTTKDEDTVDFIFTMDLLNFSFWSAAEDQEERFGIEYEGKKWTGYASLVAAMRRALNEGIPITDPHYWINEHECTLESLGHVFRSCTEEPIPMLEERLECLRTAGRVLYEKYDCSFINCIEAADGSAAGLVNLLARDFPCFRDEFPCSGRSKPVRFLKRAQILVADLWACFEGESYGEFRDIDKITIFADYRIPQILATLGCIEFSPPLLGMVTRRENFESGSNYEMQLRAASIWCVEALKREIKREHPKTHINAILIDFFLYDTMKELEAAGKETMPHHRTRSIWY